MPLHVFGRLNGAPGVTTLAAGVCAHWPELDRVLVEVDPDGGTLAADWRLRARPGLVDVAAALSDEDEAPGSALQAGNQIADFMGESFSVVCAPSAPLQARAAAARVCAPERAVLAPGDRWVIADAGRLTPDSPTWPLVAKADAVCVLVSGTVAQMMSLRGMAEALWAQAGPRLSIVVVPQTYAADDVNGLLVADGSPVEVLGEVPVLPSGRGRRARARTRAWKDLARTVFDAAVRTPTLEIEAAPEIEEVVL
jgi:hypothetical protein